jgi:hypothetical protein
MRRENLVKERRRASVLFRTDEGGAPSASRARHTSVSEPWPGYGRVPRQVLQPQHGPAFVWLLPPAMVEAGAKAGITCG